jgi:cell division transport system permease protein
MARSKPNYFYSIVSVALVLFMVGLFAQIALNGRKLTSLFKEKVDIWLELKPDISQSDVSRIIGSIRQTPFVRKESVTFITREQAVAQMKEDLGNDNMMEDLPNMLRDVIRFNVNSNFLTKDSLLEWKAQLQQDSLIQDLYFEENMTGNISKNIEKVGWFTLILGIMLIFATVTLIHNTIRLALYANRFVIKNQELVGASWGFISKPYINRSILNGLWSALLAILGLIALNWLIQRQFPEWKDLEDINGSVLIYAVMLVLGVAISGLSTYFVVNKFLKMRIDDLY